MKIEQKHRIGLSDVDFQFRAQVQAFARYFQEIATNHSSMVGAGPQALFEKGVVWFLHRLEIEIFHYPSLHEDVTVKTWSRGFKRFKGFREYVVSSDQGEIARGTSIWIFFDIARNRISKIPLDIMDRYSVEDEKWFKKEIDTWHPCGKIEPEDSINISLRYSDFDVNRHVNNAVYFGFLETFYNQINPSNDKPIRNIKIRYNQEIGMGEKHIQVGWEKNNNSYHFNVFKGENLFADGEIISAE